MNRRQFLKGVVIAAAAASIPIKLTAIEKKALMGDALTAVQAKKIEHKLIEAVYNPIQRRQKFCLHLKDGTWAQSSTGKKNFRIAKGRFADFNIADHTFIDGSRRVNCLSCFKKWFPDQPGWEEAEYMLKHTTNTRTASQQMLNLTKKIDTRGVTYYDQI